AGRWQHWQAHRPCVPRSRNLRKITMSSLQNALEYYQALAGSEVGTSSWVTIDQPMVDRFAQCTGDAQWIHTDPARATAETPFGGTVAHGFLTLSLASSFASECFKPR